MTARRALDAATASAATLLGLILCLTFFGLKQREAAVDLSSSLDRLDQLAMSQVAEISVALSSRNMTALDLKIQLLRAMNRESALQVAILTPDGRGLDSGVDKEVLARSRHVPSGTVGNLVFQRRTVSYGPNQDADAVFQSEIVKRGEGIINFVFLTFMGVVAVVLIAFFILARLSIIRFIVAPLSEIQSELAESTDPAVNAPIDHLSLSQSKTLTEIESVRSGLQYFVSELSRANNKRLSFEKELEGSRARYQLALQVAHDIRSPATALKMVATHDLGLKEEVRDLIAKAAQRINLIADNLLSEFRAAQTNQKFPLSGALKEIAAECAVVNPQTELSTIITTGAGHDVVLGNEQELKRVFSNLINNAIDAGATKIEINLKRNASGKLNLEIRDNGKGIDPSILDQLGKSPVSDGKVDGNGLGTYNASKVVREHGGTLVFKSQLGLGSSVEITLP